MTPALFLAGIPAPIVTDPAYAPLNQITPANLVLAAVNLSLGIAGVVLFFMLIRGGYLYLTAGPDKDAVQKAVKSLTTALVGAAIVFSVYAILFIVEVLFGISLRQFNLPSII